MSAPCDPRTDVAGLVLAGGQSTRMGGGDKGLLALGGESLIGRVIARLGPQVGAMAINANGDPARFASLGLPVVADTIGGFAGPLAGVLAGLTWARALGAPPRFVATVSADAPFVPLDLVARLARAAATAPSAIPLARSHGEIHSVIGLWPVALADDLAAALAGGVRKVLRWTDRHGTLPVDFDDVAIGGRAIDPFFNINTPDDLAAARALIGVARP